jgi:hypothetical protein
LQLEDMYVSLLDGFEFIEEAQKVAARNYIATHARANRKYYT